MSLPLTRVSRLLIITAVAALLFALAALSAAAGAAPTIKRVPKAERAVTVAAVHKWGVGTKTTSTCVKLRGVSGWRCAFGARPRGKKMVYAGRASVSRKLRVRFGGTICVGPGCKK
jgi:hypothetical protein